MDDVEYLGEVKRWAVFQWEQENQYRLVDAVSGLYKSRGWAQIAADAKNEGEVVPAGGYVVRPVWIKKGTWKP